MAIDAKKITFIKYFDSMRVLVEGSKPRMFKMGVTGKNKEISANDLKKFIGKNNIRVQKEGFLSLDEPVAYNNLTDSEKEQIDTYEFDRIKKEKETAKKARNTAAGVSAVSSAVAAGSFLEAAGVIDVVRNSNSSISNLVIGEAALVIAAVSGVVAFVKGQTHNELKYDEVALYRRRIYR